MSLFWPPKKGTHLQDSNYCNYCSPWTKKCRIGDWRIEQENGSPSNPVSHWPGAGACLRSLSSIESMIILPLTALFKTTHTNTKSSWNLVSNFLGKGELRGPRDPDSIAALLLYAWPLRFQSRGLAMVEVLFRRAMARRWVRCSSVSSRLRKGSPEPINDHQQQNSESEGRE